MDKEQIVQLIKDVIREELKNFIGNERYVFQKDIQIFDKRNISFGGSRGTKIGTTTTQKIGFYGATPVDQPATAVNIADVIARLKELGLIA